MRQAYPSCVVTLQDELERSYKHFTSLILDNLESHVISDICEKEGFREMVRVLRDKYLIYLGRFRFLQGSPKPHLPENLDEPPKIVIELIDLSATENITFGEQTAPKSVFMLFVFCLLPY